MSSLVTSASTWTNDDTPKKRQSSMNLRKTVKLRPDNVGEVDYQGETENLNKMQPTSIDEHKESLEKRNVRVNELLNKMTSSETEPADNKMGSFAPISPPSLNVKRDIGDNTESKSYVANIPSYLQASNDMKSAGNYGANGSGSASLSNYQRSYEPPQQLANKPYYANMGINQGSGGSADSKLMEKINYMVHLLEEQGHEKTSNITEEFILYTFLGVFIIFVVDSFSRSGKYIR
jgi:hypothetical protein